MVEHMQILFKRAAGNLSFARRVSSFCIGIKTPLHPKLYLSYVIDRDSLVRLNGFDMLDMTQSLELYIIREAAVSAGHDERQRCPRCGRALSMFTQGVPGIVRPQSCSSQATDRARAGP